MNLKKYLDMVNATEAKVSDLANRIDALFNEDKTEEALKLRPELDAAKADAKEANQLYLSMREAVSDNGDPAKRFVPMGGDPEPAHVKDMRATNEYMGEFMAALKVGATPKAIVNGQIPSEKFGRLMNALTETGGVPAGAEGGFLLPVDFDTAIKTFRRLAVDLSDYVSVEEVNTMTGWRAMEVGSAALPFVVIPDAPAPVPPATRMAEMENPAFQRVNFTLLDYGGFLPIHNNLLSDTPSAIMQYLGKWIGRKTSITHTNLIWTLAVATLAPVPSLVPANVFDSIDTALNVSLDPAISVTAAIFTNQNGFALMDSITDGMGRKYLQPDPTQPTRMQYKGRPIVVVPTAQMPDLALNTAPIMVGDGRELITMFEKGTGEMTSTNVGGMAWRNNDTEIRYIMRRDVQVVDAAAAVLISQATA
jgi:HK97 family phage major capsid protein